MLLCALFARKKQKNSFFAPWLQSADDLQPAHTAVARMPFEVVHYLNRSTKTNTHTLFLCFGGVSRDVSANPTWRTLSITKNAAHL